MTDQELKTVIRGVVARRLAERARTAAAAAPPIGSIHIGPASSQAHPSHQQYITLINPGDSCLIEPGVPCNHCGYCQSHGH